MTDLRIDTEAGPGGGQLVRVAGDVDLDNVAQLRQALAASPAGGPLVVDLSAVTYLDSSGVAALFGRARAGGLELVVRPGCVVASLVALSHLDEVATVRHA